MATENRLRAHIQDTHLEHIRDISKSKDIAETEAERLVVREGLESLGYVDKPTDAADLMLYYVRRIGLLLGFVGLICMGYGVFGPRTWSHVGFALLLTGFLFLALEEGLAAYGGVAERQPVVERTQDHA